MVCGRLLVVCGRLWSLACGLWSFVLICCSLLPFVVAACLRDYAEIYSMWFYVTKQKTVA